MERDTGELGGADDNGSAVSFTPTKPVQQMSNAEFDVWMGSLPPAPGIRSIDDVDDEDLKLAEADIAAGRIYPHSLVAAWLDTWGKPGRKSFDEWLKSSG